MKSKWKNWAFAAFLMAFWPLQGTFSELTVFVSRNRTHPESGVVKQFMHGNSSTETVIVEYQEVRLILLIFFIAKRQSGELKAANVLKLASFFALKLSFVKAQKLASLLVHQIRW